MITSRIEYQNGLRTTATHLASDEKLITDAPTDNNGKGEAFSPTDLLATSLGACMVTIMGIVAEKHGMDINGTTVDVLKIMGSDPRRVAEVQVHIEVPNPSRFSEKERRLLRTGAINCPVAKSLSADLLQTVEFNF